MRSAMRLAGKVALITGGSAGIGLTTAKRFMQEGARVAILGRSQARLDAARSELGKDALALSADITRPVEIRHAVAAVRERWDRIDILVNNAYQPQLPAYTHEISDEE